MKDLEVEDSSCYSIRNPEKFSKVPILPKRAIIQNAELYIPNNTLILPEFYAPLENLVNLETGKPLQLYHESQLERLLQCIRGGVRIEVPRILQEYSQKVETNLRELEDYVRQIVVEPQYPLRGRKVVYGVEFMNK